MSLLKIKFMILINKLEENLKIKTLLENKIVEKNPDEDTRIPFIHDPFFKT